jgi:HEAT repeat protein
MLRLMTLLLGVGCGLDHPQEAAEPSPQSPPPRADLLGDPALYAAKGAPPSGEPWDGPWVATVFVGSSASPGAQALATALGLPTRVWEGAPPRPARGELALIWLEVGSRPPQPAGPRGEGATVALLAPGDPAWAARMSAELPWLGIDVVDSAASTGLWAEPATALQEPTLAGLVAARVVAEHYALAYQAPPRPPTAIPGLAQHLTPGATGALDDSRARASAALSHPDAARVDDPEPAVRLALASSTRDQALLARLATDPDPLVRARAADQLRSVAALAELCWDPSSVVRLVATHSLARLAQQRVRDPGLQPALAAVAQRSPDAYQRWKAAFGLGWLPDQVLTLTPLLMDPDVDVRREAAASLGRQADPRAIPALSAALEDPDSFVRITVTRALAAIDDPEVLPALEAALQDPALLVAGEAALGLRQRGIHAESRRFEPPHPPADRAALEALLRSEDPTTRKDATKFVAGRDDAAQLLAEALVDPDPEVRKGAVQALGAAAGAAPLLIPLLDDPDPDVVVTSLESLRRTGGFTRAQVLPLISHPDAEQRLRAAEALASIEGGMPLETLQASPDPDERVRAAWAARYPTLAAGDPSVLVRRAAATAQPALGRDDPSLLVRAASDSPPDRHAPWWARGVIAREDDLLHLRFSFNDETKIPPSHRALRPPVVREYGHPDRG